MNFIKEIFTDPKNEGFSMTRFLLFILIASYIGESVYIVIQTKTIPDLPTAIAGLATGLYAFNTMNINVGQKGGQP